MPSNISYSILFVFFLFLNLSAKAQNAETIFKSTCAACHKISNQRLVGPGLANIHERLSLEWFSAFVTSSQDVIKSGDAYAIALFEEYNSVIMPNQPLSKVNMKSLYEYIKKSSPAVTEVITEEVVVKEIPFEPSKSDILLGQDLFSGNKKFKNSGTSCNSCHNIVKDEVMTGGSLAVDLTEAYNRLGKAGIEAMISGLPFPQMRNTYQNHPITEEEIMVLTAFLMDVSEQRLYQSQRTTYYRNILLIFGFIGSVVLMGIFPLFWCNRKKESVNKRIYERQIKSRN